MNASTVSHVSRTARQSRRPAKTKKPRAVAGGAVTQRIGGELSPLVVAALIAAPVVAAALFYVWTHVATVRLGYALTEAAEIHRELVEENRGLRIEVATLKRPDRLERLATTRYRLAPPRAGQVVKVSSTP